MLTSVLRSHVVLVRQTTAFAVLDATNGHLPASRWRGNGRRPGISLPIRAISASSAQQTNQVQHLSPYDVNLMLRENEFTYICPEQEKSTVLSYESNQLGSNKPCEDSRTEGTFIHKNGFICGIFDGHGGAACSQVVSKRLLRYLAATLVDRDTLRGQIASGCTSQSFLRCHNDKVDFVKEIKDIYEDSFNKYVEQISSQPAGSRETEIVNAFLQLDNDLSDESLNHTNMRTMAVAMSGAVACVAHIEDVDLHVASTGDCTAVLGSICPETGKWMSKKLNLEHNTDNAREVQRIRDQHPKEENDTAIRNERLLGQLAPLRALGDFRYKWSVEVMEKHVVPAFGEHAIPPYYQTPPYLTAEPEVSHHVLEPQDKFLVIGSDGLWDFLSPTQVVNLVGEHLNSRQVLEPMKLPEGDVTLDEISQMLAQRKAGRARKPLDQNSATHLIRNALGGTDFGIENSKISYYLSLPQDVVRLYRDDITITVVYFNGEHIAQHTDRNSITT